MPYLYRFCGVDADHGGAHLKESVLFMEYFIGLEGCA
jgi:hypothetical protein